MVGLTGESSMYGREAMIREAEDRVTFTAEEVVIFYTTPIYKIKGVYGTGSTQLYARKQ